MAAQLRSELLKLRTTWTVPALLAATAALTLLGAGSEGLSPTAAELHAETTQRTLLTAATSGVFLATFAGVLLVTGEFRYGTMATTLMFEPRRRVVLAAKLGAAALAGLAFAAVALAVASVAGLAILGGRGAAVALTPGQWLGLAAGTMGAAVLSALLGVAVGALVRNQVAAIVAIAGYAFAVDAVLFAAVPSLGRYLPGKAGDALAGRIDAHLLAPGAGAAVLCAWTLAFVVAALLRTERSDV